jgi:hypothetical protein
MMRSASTILVIWNDLLAFVGATVLIVAGIGSPLAVLLHLADPLPTLAIGASFFLGGFALVISRVALIKSIVSDAQDVAGRVLVVEFFRDRGRVEYMYTYQGRRYVSTNAVMKTRRTVALDPGEEVTVCVDRNRPSRAFLPVLYT